MTTTRSERKPAECQSDASPLELTSSVLDYLNNVCLCLSQIQYDLRKCWVQRTRKMNYHWLIVCRKGSQNIIFLLCSFSHWTVFISINFLMLVMTNCEKWKTCFHVYGRHHQKTHDTFYIPTVRYTKTHLPYASTHKRSEQHVTKIWLSRCFLLYNENSEAGDSGILQLATDSCCRSTA